LVIGLGWVNGAYQTEKERDLQTKPHGKNGLAEEQPKRLANTAPKHIMLGRPPPSVRHRLEATGASSLGHAKWLN
jgi:hypothetical protein